MQRYEAAAASLTWIDLEQENETAERVVVETAQLNLLMNNQDVVTNQEDIRALRIVAEGYSTYMNTARALLHQSIGEYQFKHRPVILPISKMADKTNPANLAANGSFAIYPNPTNGQLFIDLMVDQLAQWSTVKVYDLHGRVLRNIPVTANKMLLDVAEFPAGTYIISLIDGEGVLVSEKFVKQ